jgi:hypothetical protein
VTRFTIEVPEDTIRGIVACALNGDACEIAVASKHPAGDVTISVVVPAMTMQDAAACLEVLAKRR